MAIKCVALEDEVMALSVIQDYISKTPFLQLRGSFRNPLEALPVVMQEQPELIFLDINMPDLSGMEFLNSLNYQPYVIFTTAYSEFALESFDHKTVDYVLKPIRFDRFLKAVVKAQEFIQTQMPIQPKGDEGGYFFVKSGHETHRIAYTDLLYIEGSRNYLYYHLGNRKIIARQTLSDIEKSLPAHQFARVHKSFIINLAHMETVRFDSIQIGPTKIPIGRTYRDRLRQILDGKA